jgi:hypothetical protein
MSAIPKWQFKKLRVMGLPYHGKVKGGQVTLDSNQAVRSYPQIGASNLLLEAVGSLPDRSGNPIDQAEGWDWRDRLLLQISDSPTGKPAGIHSSDFLYIDPSKRTWLMTISIETAGIGYRLSVILKQRWGVISDKPHTVFNTTIFTSSNIDLSQYSSSLGLQSVGSLDFVSQNPRGDTVLVGIGGGYQSPVSMSALASIAEVNITGSISPATGLGAQATMSQWRTADQLVEEPRLEEVNAPIKMIKRKETTTVTCSGVPGTGTVVYTETLEYLGVVPDQSDPLGFYYQDDPEYSADIQRTAIHAFYNEDGAPSLVEIESTDKHALDISFAWADDLTNECEYDVTASTPLPHWLRTSATSLRTVTLDETITVGNEQSIRLIIGGAEKESVKLSETHTDIHSYSATEIDQHISCFNTGQHPCANSYYEAYGFISGAPLAPNVGQSSHFTVTSNGGTIYDSDEDPAFYGSLNIVPGFRQLSNRVFGLVIQQLVADHIGTGKWFGAHTDTDGISGQAQEFAVYNPYDMTVSGDDQYFGFV